MQCIPNVVLFFVGIYIPLYITIATLYFVIITFISNIILDNNMINCVLYEIGMYQLLKR